MSDPRNERDLSQASFAGDGEIVRYPENHLISVVDTRDQVESAVQSLESSGFLPAEISVASGQVAADALGATTGRGGLTNIVIRVARSLGLQNEESETKDRYEQALRDGHYVVAVQAPTDARKELAAQLLASRGGRLISFLGRRTIEHLSR
jgi:hypothetical protein